jgi:protein disulfide-isomerase
MKKIISGLLVGWALAQAGAAEAEWLTDLPQAQAKAKAEKKMVLLEFTGSDWCPPCKALHKNVLTAAEFTDYAKTHLVLVELDFPRGKTQSEELKKANEALMKKFNVEGYPTVIILDADGKPLKTQVGYDGTTAKEFVAELKKLKS